MAMKLDGGGTQKRSFSGGGGTFKPAAPKAPAPARVGPTIRGPIALPAPRPNPYQAQNVQRTFQAAPAPAPAYRAPAAPAYIPPAPAWNPPAINWGNVGGGGGGGNAQAFAAPAPPPPPVDTRRRIKQSDFLDKSGGRDKELGEIDSTFADQDAAFAEALKKYGIDFDLDVKRQDRDLETARTGIGRNKQVGLTGMSEDFAARGMNYGGLFADENLKAGTQYEQQKTRALEGRNDNVAKLTANKGKFESETTNSRQAARREALARLANRTDLVVE